MAGIGFELRKVVNKGGIGSFFQIAMSGAMIVAGPWLLSIITISLIRAIMSGAIAGDMELFMGVVIYSYAFSLFLFGGFHYIFTRRMSDLLYLRKEGEAFGYVLMLCIPVGIISAIIALPAVLSFNLAIEHAAVFRLFAVLLFVTVNCLWLIMLFVSVLKWYIKIMLVYTAGLASSLLLIFLLSPVFGIAGAMAGFTLGHMLIVILLILLCRLAWKPLKPGTPGDIVALEQGSSSSPVRLFSNFISYIIKHRFLFGAGLLYYWGIWVDKIIFWAVYGVNVTGTFIRLFESYDITVYLANLTMIPGLIFFVVYSETEFYTALKRFLLTISSGRYTDILVSKKKLASVTWNSLKEQSILQAVVTIVCIILTASFILKTSLTAVFFHLMLLTLLNFLFYIEQYRHAFYASTVFFIVNAVIAAAGILPQIPQIPGISYLAGAAAASAAAGFMLKNDLSRLERHILTKN
ncbi:MAG: exopolysaccharide Pel transporter PelG [Spirochaetales bacterium]|uniref:Exopolysaccharide Pel transporter PelG n=1 Tax=Candidatus Thalassospirochaeta sargassi TaxID=3119039 RepID=A0AAJ1IFP1_9SPIO|nr:exopolysaccharide Pel transporter PelG [Spirochaetales bacterium]